MYLEFRLGNGNRPHGRSRRRCAGTVKTDLKGIGWYSMDWTCQAEDRDSWRALANTVMGG